MLAHHSHEISVAAACYTTITIMFTTPLLTQHKGFELHTIKGYGFCSSGAVDMTELSLILEQTKYFDRL